MLGRRLDRYVTSFFLWHFGLCLVAVLGLYIVVETFTDLDQFMRHADTWEMVRWIAIFHLYHTPLLVGQFLPIVTLLAGIISLARLATYNELNAMKATGVSMRRTVAPVLLCTLVIGALAAVDQEWLLPRLENRIREVEFEAKGGDVSTSLWLHEEESGITIEARQLDTTVDGKELRTIEAAADPEVGPDGQLRRPATLRAEKAIWASHWMFLANGSVTDSSGKEHPFAWRVLRTDVPVQDFDPASDRAGRLADGTPAYLFRAHTGLPALRFAYPTATGAPTEVLPDPLGPRPLVVQFAAVDVIGRFRLIFDGQIAGSYAGEKTLPPLSFPVALWQEDRWLGRAQTYAEVGKDTPQPHRDLIVYDGHPLPITTPPAQLARKRVDPSLKSFAYLLGKARENPGNRRLCQRIHVLLHGRLAFPLANFVLLFLAIPLLFQHEGGKSTWVGVGLALLVSLGFYFFSYFCQVVGQDPQGVFAGMPALAAWLPVAVFGLSGTVLFANINT